MMIGASLAAFARWLPSNPLEGDEPFGTTGARYQVARYCDFLEANPWHGGDPLKEARARDEAVKAYRLYLEIFAQQGTIEQVVRNLDHFYVFLGLGPVTQRRESASASLRAG
jgi:hypothetical protein